MLMLVQNRAETGRNSESSHPGTHLKEKSVIEFARPRSGTQEMYLILPTPIQADHLGGEFLP